MDKCLMHPTGSQGGYTLHYHSLGLCMQPSSAWTSTSLVPTLCDSAASPECISKPFEWALAAWTDKANYGGEVGLARDGHVIVGPYNGYGELWSCDDHDVCNGTFIDDGSFDDDFSNLLMFDESPKASDQVSSAPIVSPPGHNEEEEAAMHLARAI